jgi:uncharacterized protein
MEKQGVTMCRLFYPDDYINSTYDIDFAALFREGYRGLIFDIDNTLVPHDAPADERSKVLFSYLKELGFRIILISNNKEARVKMFNDEVQVAYIYLAHKPGKESFLRAMDMLETDAKTTIMIGDQLFTDILGAKNAGIRNILVKPIHPKEKPHIMLKRLLEKIILYFYVRSLNKSTSHK